MADVGIH